MPLPKSAQTLRTYRPGSDNLAEDYLALFPRNSPMIRQLRSTLYHPGFISRAHNVSDLAFFFTVTGRCEVRCSKEGTVSEGTLTAGRLFVREAGGSITFVTRDQPWEFRKLIVADSIRQRWPHPFLQNLPVILTIHHVTRINTLFDQMLDLVQAPSPRTYRLCNDLLPVLLEMIALDQSERPGPANAARAKFLECKEFIDTHYEEIRGIADVAAQCHLSGPHLWRLFQRFHGSSPAHYLRQVKLTRAVQLLQSSPLTIGQIADQLGYPDPQTFSRAFKQAIGCSPSHIRFSPEQEVQ